MRRTAVSTDLGQTRFRMQMQQVVAFCILLWISYGLQLNASRIMRDHRRHLTFTDSNNLLRRGGHDNSMHAGAGPQRDKVATHPTCISCVVLTSTSYRHKMASPSNQIKRRRKTQRQLGREADSPSSNSPAPQHPRTCALDGAIGVPQPPLFSPQTQSERYTARVSFCRPRRVVLQRVQFKWQVQTRPSLLSQRYRVNRYQDRLRLGQARVGSTSTQKPFGQASCHRNTGLRSDKRRCCERSGIANTSSHCFPHFSFHFILLLLSSFFYLISYCISLSCVLCSWHGMAITFCTSLVRLSVRLSKASAVLGSSATKLQISIAAVERI